MSNFLTVAVACDGVSQDCNGKERAKFDQILEMLLNCKPIPATLCFYGEGIRWLTQESPVIDKLDQVCRHGVQIVACHHCMAEAGLLDQMAIGQLETEDHIDEMLRHSEHAMVL